MKTIIAFAPHPDDAELFCGGILARSSDKGYKTGVIDMTRGELSSQGNLETRAKEVDEASAILGLSIRENLELADGHLSELENLDGDSSPTTKVVSCIRCLKPDIVLLPFWKSRHPDHSATSRIVQRALFFCGVKKYAPQAGLPHRPQAEIYYQMRVAFEPSFISDISEVQERKMKAAAAYSSQIVREGDDKQQKSPPTLVSSPLSLSSIEARDAQYGAQIGCAFGEPFLTRQTVRIDDPVLHFSELQKDPSLFLNK
jgi:bacillithiol biosynthesis deacetylase BshB1